MERFSAPDLHVIDYEKDNCMQLVLGVDHARCLTQADAYQYYYQQFLGHVATHKTDPVILYEGVSIPNSETSEEDCLRSERGEVSLLFHWAQRDNIKLESFEVSDQDLLLRLAEKIGYLEEVGVYLIARQHRQWYDMPDRPDFTAYMHDALERYRKAALELNQLRNREIYPEETFDVTAIIKYFNQQYDGRQFDVHDRDFFQKETANRLRFNESAFDVPLRATTEEVNRIRQQHIKMRLLQHADEEKSVFAFIGHPHIRNLGRGLRREVFTVPIRDCIGKLVTGATHRPNVVNSERTRVLRYDCHVPSDAPNLPIIEVLQGDSKHVIVGTHPQVMSEQLPVFQRVYEDFLRHVATRDTTPLMLSADTSVEKYSLTRPINDLLYDYAQDENIAYVYDGWDTPEAAALFYKLRPDVSTCGIRLGFDKIFHTIPTYDTIKQAIDTNLEHRYTLSAVPQHTAVSWPLSPLSVIEHNVMQIFEHYYGAPLGKLYQTNSGFNAKHSVFPTRFPPDYMQMVRQTHLANVLHEQASQYNSVFMCVDPANIETLLPRIRRKMDMK